MKLLIVQCSPVSCYYPSHMPKYNPQHCILKEPKPLFFTLIKQRVLFILISIFVDSSLEDKSFFTKWRYTFSEFNVLFICLGTQCLFVSVVHTFLYVLIMLSILLLRHPQYFLHD